MASVASLLCIASQVLPIAAMIMTGRPEHGLIGYGIPMYEPLCPYACREALSSSPLHCSATMIMDGESMTDTSTLCYAADSDFLTSMAWCIKQHCTDLKPWKIENWWYHEIPGKQAEQPDPKWTYQQTLDSMPTAPAVELSAGSPLNTTVLVSKEQYELQALSLAVFAEVEVNHSKYGLILLISAVVIPVAASLLRFLPLPGLLTSRIYAIFIDREVVHSRRGWILRQLGGDLTRGQAIFGLYLLVVNLVLCIVGYRVADPSAWFPAGNRQFLTYVANRTGVLSFANVPVLLLYAGRNSFLRWITDWEYATFVVLHGWVAVLCTLEACVHSLLYLVFYVQDGTHNSEAKLPYWYWGIIATLGFSLLLPASVQAIRKRAYEVFLASHFAIALLSLVGCYLHIYYKFEHQWGYELWIFVGFAIWSFDRLLRLLRVARYGIRTATITVIDADHVRLDIAGLTGDGHAYFYFPTLTWRVWENHPFSISTTLSPLPQQQQPTPSDTSSSLEISPSNEKLPKAVEATTTTLPLPPSADKAAGPNDTQPSLTLFIRTCAGATALLAHHHSLPVLVESGYATAYTVPPASHLVCIAGGVGVTALLPTLQTHRGRVRLYWSCRSRELVDAVEPLLDGVEREVLVGARLEISSLLEAEVRRGSGELVVLVSGPKGMMGDVREVVGKLARRAGRPVRLLEESFAW